MTTLNFRPAPPRAVAHRSSVTVSDEEFARLGITKEAERLVFGAIKRQALKHEASVAKAAGLDELTATRALHALEHRHLIRRGAAPFGGLAPFELIPRR